jgi:MoxR-like ATPase
LSVQSQLQRGCELLDARHRGATKFDQGALDEVIREALPNALGRIVGPRRIVEGRTGIGSAADVPWVGIFSAARPASARQGFYLVYLFAADGSTVYLSLNQGTEHVKGGMGVLLKRAIDLRRAAGDPSEFAVPIHLRSTNTRPKRYEAGSALARAYYRDQIPGDADLQADLEQFLAFLASAEGAALQWDPEIEPLHLVFKWSVDRNSRTIEIHREVAERQGAVWWGRFASSPRPSIDDRKLRNLQSQIEASTPTFAFLYRRGSLWRARLQALTTEPPTPDDPRFPSYYRPEECNLFALLTEFEQLDPEWLPANAVLASHPDPDPSRLASALSNQTNPLFLYLLGGPSADLAPEASDDDGWQTMDLSTVSLLDVCTEVQRLTRDAGLRFGPAHDAFIRSAMVSVATKRFVLLTGLSGSGKTRLAIAIGEWFGADRNIVIPVRPDWTGPDAIFGFENALGEPRNGQRPWAMTRALEFIIQAARDRRHPYLLVLDEMNLAHVERYFADVLSGMESRTPVVPNVTRDGDEWRLMTPPYIEFPPNLFVMGTVNVDETTYMFSPKVLDRANTIEFRVGTEDLQIESAPVSPVEAGTPLLVSRFLAAATTIADDDDWEGRNQLGEWLIELHGLLRSHDREFGHRVFVEALRYGSLLAETAETDPLVALDAQVLQKILPKLHGSIRQIAEPLQDLAAWCWQGPGKGAMPSGFDPLDDSRVGQPVLPMSFDKVRRMTRRLRANHFASFAE